VVVINKTYSRHTITHDRTYRITAPKSKSRTIAIPDNLTELLNQLKNYFTNQKIKIKPSDFIFGINKPVSDSDILRIKNRHCEIAGVPQIRLHDFRHSLVSLLINRTTADTIKNPLQLAYIIADRIGDNIDQIFKTYGHLFKTDEKAVINCLNIPL
jgi:integrase